MNHWTINIYSSKEILLDPRIHLKSYVPDWIGLKQQQQHKPANWTGGGRGMVRIHFQIVLFIAPAINLQIDSSVQFGLS